MSITSIQLRQSFDERRAVQLGQSCDRMFCIVCDRLGLDRDEAIKAPLEMIALARAEFTGRPS